MKINNSDVGKIKIDNNEKAEQIRKIGKNTEILDKSLSNFVKSI